MNIFKFFSSVWRKLVWVITLVYTYVSPIYNEVMAIIKEVDESTISNDDKRKAVFQKITQFIKKYGLKQIPDSVLNTIIELCYQIYKNKKA